MIKNEFVLDVGMQVPAVLSKEKYAGARTLRCTIAVLNCVVMPLLLVASTFSRHATLNQVFSFDLLASTQM